MFTIHKSYKFRIFPTKKLKYEQHQLSKKQKGSHSRLKQKRKLASVHEKITNIRKDYLDKVSTEIIKNHDVITVEDWAVKNMLKNHRLAQVMNDVSLGTFYTILEYKAKWNQEEYVKIDLFLPSSKRCSNCGEVHDSDLNTSINILNQGFILSGYGMQSDVKQKRAEALSIGKSMNPEALPISFTMGG